MDRVKCLGPWADGKVASEPRSNLGARQFDKRKKEIKVRNTTKAIPERSGESTVRRHLLAQ